MGSITFPRIVDTIADVVSEHRPSEAGSVEEVMAVDAWARARAAELLNR
jgi:1-deoxy-D-xylulose-5-phosphate reductoisomerase